MRVYVLLATCLAWGCTRANGDFNGGAGGSGGFAGGGGSGGVGGGTGGNGGGDLSVSAHDMSAHGGVDLSHATHDLAALCSPDERHCLPMPVASLECSGGQLTIDRRCPFGSTTKGGADCSAGYCQPPTTNGTTGCDGGGGPLENICSGPGNSGKDFSCQPFITDPASQTVEWWCAIAATMGTGSAGDSCSKGSDCHSGFCGSNGTCFFACQSTADCPIATNKGVLMPCTQVTLDVEGVSVSAKSCTP